MLDIDWSKAPEDAMFAAKDSDGQVRFFECKPCAGDHSWRAENGDVWRAIGMEEFLGTTLTKRPE